MSDERKKQKEKNELGIVEMRKRREKMADGKRYIIYYTFGKDSKETSTPIPEEKDGENV